MKDLDTIIKTYLDKGFGSMNKNDFEVWIFYYLLQNHFQGLNNFEISVELRIPESKVKRLRYEAELKHGTPNDRNVYTNAFSSLLSKAVLKEDGSCIKFVVEDIQLRKFLDSVLKKGGRFSNTSFNSEIVAIDADDLDFLLKTLWPDKDWNSIYEKIKKKTGDKEASLKGLFKYFVKNAVGQAGKIMVDLSYSGIKALLEI